MDSQEEKLRQVTGVIDELIEDNSVPRNIRQGAEDAKERLLEDDDPLDVRVASAVSTLDDLANDPNIPLHGRTVIWNIISGLESISAK
jgi:uncharacterized protein (UPF0147 family)